MSPAKVQTRTWTNPKQAADPGFFLGEESVIYQSQGSKGFHLITPSIVLRHSVQFIILIIADILSIKKVFM